MWLFHLTVSLSIHRMSANMLDIRRVDGFLTRMNGHMADELTDRRTLCCSRYMGNLLHACSSAGYLVGEWIYHPAMDGYPVDGQTSQEWWISSRRQKDQEENDNCHPRPQKYTKSPV